MKEPFADQTVLIVGGGPAGASLAIRLARAGCRVTLIEKDVFPRHKLCGEFVSPESFGYLRGLGVYDEIVGSGAGRISETRFNSRSGRVASIPTGWFGRGEFALGISRARFDEILLNAAIRAGATVEMGARVISVRQEKCRITSVSVRHDDGSKADFSADLFVDASGRNAVLSPAAAVLPANIWIASKFHLRGAAVAPHVCEMFSFAGGYGGLLSVEGGLANLCVIMRAETGKAFIGKANLLIDYIRDENGRAAQCLRETSVEGDRLSVRVAGYGIAPPPQFDNAVSIGDAGSFIDPFTGSGIFSALESANLLADHLLHGGFDAAVYRRSIAHAVRPRHRVASILRSAAARPNVASGVIALASLSGPFAPIIARLTRANAKPAGEFHV